MSTRSTSTDLVPHFTDPDCIIQNRQRNLGDPSFLLDFEEINMANNNNVQGPPHAGPNILAPDLRPMEELLQEPTNGVGDEIVVPPVLASQIELKIAFLILLPLSRAARTWLEKEPPNSITTWNDLVSKFVNQLFPPSRTTNLRNEITRFQQRFIETFKEARDRFEDILNKCPHYGFSPLHQIDTFYSGLNQSDQDSLNSAAGGNFLTKNTQEALTIIENKSKVRTSRNKPQASIASDSSSQNDAITALSRQVEALTYSTPSSIRRIQFTEYGVLSYLTVSFLANLLHVKMDDPNINMEEYIKLEEEKARRNAIVFDNALTSKVTPSYEPTVNSLTDNEIDFRISFNESDDEDYTSQELKCVSYHKLYDILKQHQNKKIRAERLVCTANPLKLVAQQQLVYHPQNHPTHYTQNSSTRPQQAATRNKEKVIVNSPQPIYDQEPKMVVEDDALSKEKEIDKLIALISLSFKKIYTPTNNNLKTSSNTSREN
nr:hypothetical protein [Tanacetum cinerariifolium]